jgi:hypothetical protein
MWLLAKQRTWDILLGFLFVGGLFGLLTAAAAGICWLLFCSFIVLITGLILVHKVESLIEWSKAKLDINLQDDLCRCSFCSTGNIAFEKYYRESLTKLRKEREQFEAFIVSQKSDEDKKIFDSFWRVVKEK